MTSRRPGWVAGSLEVLERYCVTILEAERIEAEVREATPGNDRHTPQDGDAPLVA